LVTWAVRRRLARSDGGANFSDLSKVPNSLTWPLERTGLDLTPRLAALRSDDSLTRLAGLGGITAWLATGRRQVKDVLANSADFSNDFRHLAGGDIEATPGGLGFADPPDHTRLRRLLTPEFTMRRLARLQPRISAIVDGQLDVMARAGGPVDLWRDFALPVPTLTICELLGVPYEDRDRFQRLAAGRFDLESAGARESVAMMSEALDYLLDLVRRKRSSPGNGLLDALIRDHGDDVTDKELAGLADGILTGGLETSASMIALGVLTLLRHRDAGVDLDWDTGTDRYVEELLRFLTPVQVAFPRFAARPVQLGETTVQAGDLVVCSLSAANRDEREGAGMNEFDTERQTSPHVAFGYGIHRCVGAELARMELRTVFPALFRRFPDLRLENDGDDLAFRKKSIVYGVDSLRVVPQ
jgi:cytochrome P450